MAKATTTSVASRNASIDAKLATLGTTAVLKTYTGSPPATPETAATGTLLVTHSLPNPAFAAASAGSAALGTVADVNAVAAGVAGYCRFETGAGVGVMDVIAGESADTPNMVFNNKTFAIGDPISITGYTYSEPASSSL